MKNSNSVNASFTGREMEAIAAMLLSADGINVDPIINDLYPDLNDSQKSMFRCKLALMLKGNMPEFKPVTGFRRTGSATCYLYEITSESSLLGVYHLKKLSKYTREKGENGQEKWNEVTMENYEKNSVETQGFEFQLYGTLDEAIKDW